MTASCVDKVKLAQSDLAHELGVTFWESMLAAFVRKHKNSYTFLPQLISLWGIKELGLGEECELVTVARFTSNRRATAK